MGQSYSTPFMSIKDSYVNKRVKIDTKDGLEGKIHRLMIMMSKTNSARQWTE